MQTPADFPSKVQRTVAVIMGGGAGTRLFPLTKDRAKPAVPLAGKYRLVDIPISNCLNSNMRKIYLLTQFNSSSLHRHVQRTYQFDNFSSGFVEIMAAQQTYDQKVGWYQGTADAVRVNLHHFDNDVHDYVLILSGDQLYRMDYRKVLAKHITSGADVTVCCLPVPRASVAGFGIMQLDPSGRIVRFVEKPKETEVQDSLKMDANALASVERAPGDELWLANMGIYLFNKATLKAALSNNQMDFGKHIIPALISKLNMAAYVYDGYWEDIGTIGAFYEANLDLCHDEPKFNYGEVGSQIYTRPRNLPPNKIGKATLEKSVLCAGIRVGDNSTLSGSLFGNRSIVGSGVTISDTLMMGADYFDAEKPSASGSVPIGVGDGTVVNKAILDKNARIGRNCRITPEGKDSDCDGELYHVRDGIIVIPKGAVIPDNTIL